MISCPSFAPYSERYAELPLVPLTITLELVAGARIAGYDPLNLDNLLARGVVDEATRGAGLPSTPEGYDLPVPLRCLWRSVDELPLWAATPFVPVTNNVRDVTYCHKRAQPGRLTGTKSGRFQVASNVGRWMERRIPVPTAVCGTWQATCVGNAEEIARLLRTVVFAGKRRAIGFGEVKRWRIESLSIFNLIENNCLLRSLPAMAVHLLNGQRPRDALAPVGWTPPQWKPSLFMPGWWIGTLVTGEEAISES